MRPFDKVMAAVMWQVPTTYKDRIIFEKHALLLIKRYQSSRTEEQKETCWVEGSNLLSFFFANTTDPWAGLLSKIYKGEIGFEEYLK